MSRRPVGLQNTLRSMLYHRPWPASSAAVPELDPSIPIEEENTPYYHSKMFYPARLGDILRTRYQIATKLGFGSSSTVWLARDLQRMVWMKERYVAIKINASGGTGEVELSMLKRIQKANSQHEGWHFIRQLVDSFTLDGAQNSKHICLVFEPLREPLWLYCRRFVGRVIPPDILKILLQMILQGLDYLHSECNIIHTDLKPDNIMVKLEDQKILERDARDEYNHPLPQKKTADGRVIYLSRNNYGQMSSPTGLIQITDFGHSVLGDIPNTGCIQAEMYRAPEVILDSGYTSSADIWSLGVMLWDLLEGRKLFDMTCSSNTDVYDDSIHLASITALLGPAPPCSLKAGTRTSMFYSEGQLKESSSAPEGFTFHSTINSMKDEEKEMFINFARRMIKWDPAARSTAKELLQDPWLYSESE